MSLPNPPTASGPTGRVKSASLPGATHIAEHIAAIIASLPPEIAARVRRDTERFRREAEIADNRCRLRARRDPRGPWVRRSGQIGGGTSRT